MDRLPKIGVYSSCLVHNYVRLKGKIRKATNIIPNEFTLLNVFVEVESHTSFFSLKK